MRLLLRLIQKLIRWLTDPVVIDPDNQTTQTADSFAISTGYAENNAILEELYHNLELKEIKDEFSKFSSTYSS